MCRINGSQIEKEAVVSCLNSDYVFIWHDNNLGAKKNIILEFAEVSKLTTSRTSTVTTSFILTLRCSSYALQMK